jgi:DNA (cytosine-5)-methyltransferase 1
MTEKIVRANDFFCGAGGMGLGFKQAGFRLGGAWDFDKYAVESYGNNVSPKVKQADITQMTADEVPFADVWTFGFPCQDISIAGKQAGMIKGETRSGLFYEVMRLLDEVEYKPSVILAENVKAVNKFIPTIEEEYEKAGYRLVSQLYNSKYWGVPQNRERYFLLGIRKDIEKDFIFPEQQTDFIPKLSSVLDSDVDEKYYIDDLKAAKIIEQAMNRIELKNVHPCITPDRVDKRQNGRRAKDNEEEMYTLTAQDLHGVIQASYSPEGVGTYNPKKPDGTQTYQQDRIYDVKGVSPTVSAELGGRMNILEQPKIEVIGMLDMKGHDLIRRVYDPEGLAPTLNTCQGGNLQPKILETCKLTDQGSNFQGFTETSGTLLARDYKGFGNQEMDAIIENRYRVRKLTPREYARLQGFPESYKQVVSNSQFYKQMGNAVTVNVSHAIAETIKEFLLSE